MIRWVEKSLKNSIAKKFEKMKSAHRRNKSSVASLEDLPKEIIIEILLLLPVKTLMVLTCVSKSLKSMITDPIFIVSHLKLSQDDRNSKGHIFCFTHRVDLPIHEAIYSVLDKNSYSREIKKTRLYSNLKFTIYVIVGSCNGLICLVSPRHNAVRDFLLFNPLISRHPLWLPRSPGCHIIHLPIDGLGFGFHQATNDYKVIKIVQRRVYLFSLNTRTWKKVGATPPLIIGGKSVYWNGMIHWLAEDVDSKFNIISFDLDEEVFKVIELPEFYPPPLGREKFSVIQELRGSLNVLICQVLSNKKLRCNVCAMREYGVVDPLVKQFNVTLKAHITGILGMNEVSGEFLYFTTGKNFFGSPDPDHYAQDLVAYNLDKSQNKYVRKVRYGYRYSSVFFKESLVLSDIPINNRML